MVGGRQASFLIQIQDRNDCFTRVIIPFSKGGFNLHGLSCAMVTVPSIRSSLSLDETPLRLIDSDLFPICKLAVAAYIVAI